MEGAQVAEREGTKAREHRVELGVAALQYSTRGIYESGT